MDGHHAESPKGKYWRLGGVPRLRCVLAGVGDEDNLRLAIQAFWAHLLQRDAAKIRTRDVHERLQAALTEVYTNHVRPNPNSREGDFGILIGVSTPDDLPMLFKTAGTGILIADSYEYVYLGSGFRNGDVPFFGHPQCRYKVVQQRSGQISNGRQADGLDRNKKSFVGHILHLRSNGLLGMKP